MLEQRMHSKHHQHMRRQTGFSLLELAVVLAILGILFSGILVAVSATTENARRTETRAQLNNVMQALYGFAQANGRLPCPATDTSDGNEMPPGGGICNSSHGFVPINTLGLAGSVNTDTLLLDAWGNPLRYSVGGNADFTDATNLRAIFNSASLPGLLSICDDSSCADLIADTVPAVVLSMGANWSTPPSADELVNAGGSTLGTYPVSGDDIFVSADYSEEDFDDIIVWMSPYVLFTRLISAGRLP